MGRWQVPGEGFGIKSEPHRTITMTGSGSTPRQLTHRGMLAMTLAGRPRDGPRAQATGLEPRAHLFAAQLTFSKPSFSLALGTSAAREGLQHACTGERACGDLARTANHAPGNCGDSGAPDGWRSGGNGGGEELTCGDRWGRTARARGVRASCLPGPKSPRTEPRAQRVTTQGERVEKKVGRWRVAYFHH